VLQHAIDHPIDTRRFHQVMSYGCAMTAAAAYPMPEPKRRPFADASPAEVRAALIPEEVPDFDRQWRAAMAEATQTMDLTPVLETLEHWRLTAWMTTAYGPEVHRRMLAQAEHTLRTGEVPPGTVPWSQVKAELGL
jgi:hypothetical protein